MARFVRRNPPHCLTASVVNLSIRAAIDVPADDHTG